MKEGGEAIKGDGWVKIGLRSHKTEEGATKRAKKVQPYKGTTKTRPSLYLVRKRVRKTKINERIILCQLRISVTPIRIVYH